MHRFFKYVCFVFLAIGHYPCLISQDCCIEQSFIINDNFSTTINIEVSGVLLDDLSDLSQGLCAIEIGFEHGAIGQVEASVFSPAGQSVQFIGASGANNDITQNISWDISFIQKSESPNPDPGQNPTWTNEAVWPLFPGNNTGSYYPFMGCLTDLNLGPVNGNWQIVFQDVTQTQDGQIDFIKLIFCEPANVNCQSCQDDELEVNLITEDISCNGEFGLVDVVSDETFIEYQWIGPGGFESTDFLPLITTPGTYYVTLTSDAGCTFVDSFLMNLEPGITDLIFEDIPFECNQLEGYFLQSGDPSLWTFEWFGPNGFLSDAPNPIITDLGIYTILLTNIDSSCVLNFTLEAYQSEGPQIELISTGDISCVQETVTISADIIGDLNGNPIWTGPAVFTFIDPFTIEVNQSGWYTIEALDLNGCQTKDSVFVDNQVLFPTINISDNIESVINCHNGGITLEAFASGDGVSISWQDSQGEEIIGDTPFVTDAGWYYAIAESSNSCQAIDSIELATDTIKPQIDFFVFMGGELTCLVDSVRIDVFLGTPNINPELNWSGPNNFSSQADILIVYEPGTYVLEVEDMNGCISVDSVVITSAFDPPDVEPLEDVFLGCTNQFAIIEPGPIGPFDSCIWSDENGELSTDCDLIVNSGGIYYLSVTNLDGCTHFDTVEVFPDLDSPMIDFLYDGEPFSMIEQVFLDCNTDSIQISFNSSLPLLSTTWTLPSNGIVTDSVIIAYEPGSYAYLMQSENGCLAQGVLFIYQDTLPPVIDFEVDTINCNNQGAQITIIDDANDPFYDWTGPDILEDNDSLQLVTVPGNYSVTITDIQTGCLDSIEIMVIEDVEEADLQLSADTISCQNESVMILTQSSMFLDSIEWVGPNFTSTDLQPMVTEPGWYYLTVEGENGCLSIDSILISADLEEPEFGVQLDTLSCENSEVTICATDVMDDINIEWFSSFGQFIASGQCHVFDQSAEYVLVVTGQNGCQDSSIFTIPIEEENLDASITILPYLDTTCIEGITLMASVTGFQNPIINWNTTDGNIVFISEDEELIEVDQVGTYSFTVMDENTNCMLSTSIVVDQIPEPIMGVNAVTSDAACIGDQEGSITIEEVIGGQEPYFFSLNGMDSQTDGLFQNLLPGNYNLFIQDINGCRYNESFTILSDDGFEVDLGPDIFVSTDQVFLVTAEIGLETDSILSINWESELEIPCSDCFTFETSALINSTIEIIVESINGCQSRDTLSVFIQASEPSIEFANIFSPNGDGQNDTFGLYPYQEIEQIVSFTIYDRWGNKLFQIENVDPESNASQWDGRHNGKDVQSGVYAFYMEWERTDGSRSKRSGSITLIR